MLEVLDDLFQEEDDVMFVGLSICVEFPDLETNPLGDIGQLVNDQLVVLIPVVDFLLQHLLDSVDLVFELLHDDHALLFPVVALLQQSRLQFRDVGVHHGADRGLLLHVVQILFVDLLLDLLETATLQDESLLVLGLLLLDVVGEDESALLVQLVDLFRQFLLDVLDSLPFLLQNPGELGDLVLEIEVLLVLALLHLHLVLLDVGQHLLQHLHLVSLLLVVSRLQGADLLEDLADPDPQLLLTHKIDRYIYIRTAVDGI